MKFRFFCGIAVLMGALAACSPAALAGESHEHRMEFHAHDRSYLIYRPASLDKDKAVPLVIVLHGGFGSGAQAEKSYGWDEEADAKGFVVAYPDGVRHSWNAGGACCGRARRDDVDDVGFLNALIDRVVHVENIDPKRVYMTGMSNGAAMAYRYACEGSFSVAAFGSVSGDMTASCPHPRAVSLMEIHGLADRNIPFKGGRGSKGVTHIDWPPVAQTVGIFRRAGECTAPATSTKGPVKTEMSACKGGREVVLTTIADAGHQWPGGHEHSMIGRMLLRLDPPSRALDATSVLWNFFAGHKAP
ncbi:MAG: polyhydroxybutyrate depolymerase [Alphaproteobacteria bacterium]|nr:polyhydroxybutyrate depolymerase [Alphaproteobacteria bacterium]